MSLLETNERTQRKNKKTGRAAAAHIQFARAGNVCETRSCILNQYLSASRMLLLDENNRDLYP